MILAAADFVLTTLSREGRLLVTCRDGEARLPAYADDYAFMIEALIDLYEATGDVERLEQAQQLADTFLEFFWDDTHGGFFFTASDHESLIIRIIRNFTMSNQ